MTTVGHRFCKRIFDLVFSMLGLLLLSPVLIVVALLVRMRLGSPVLFLQQRPGLHGKPFHIYKFRTMTNACAADGTLLSNEERLTPLGQFLRAASLDELPELLNVLRGQMSLVGPRPLLMRYLDRYNSEQARRHDVLPGITGWAQINGRNAITWEDKFKLDVWYVDHCSVWLDLKILFLTVWKVVRREGIDQPGYTSAEDFMGAAQKPKSESMEQ